MHGGYRLVIAAALGLAALVILGTGAYFGALYGTHYSQEAAIAANRDASAKQGYPSQIDRDRAGLPETAERIASGPDPQSTDEREKRDLAAQESTSVWAFWMLIVSALGVVTTMLGTGFLLWQIRLTREAVEDTGKATAAMVRQNELTEQSQRPWIFLEVEIGIASFQTSGHFRIPVLFRMKNIGASQASKVSCNFIVQQGDSDSPSPQIAIDVHEKLTDDGISIMPGESFEYRQVFFQKEDDLIWKSDRGYVESLFIHLAGAVSYFGPGENSRFFTGRTYVMGISDNTDPFVAWRIPKRRMNSISSCKLTATPRGWMRTVKAVAGTAP